MRLDCAEATRLLSDALDRLLLAHEARALDDHLQGCTACVECGAQFRALRRLLRGWREHVDP